MKKVKSLYICVLVSIIVLAGCGEKETDRGMLDADSSTSNVKQLEIASNDNAPDIVISNEQDDIVNDTDSLTITTEANDVQSIDSIVKHDKSDICDELWRIDKITHWYDYIREDTKKMRSMEGIFYITDSIDVMGFPSFVLWYSPNDTEAYIRYFKTDVDNKTLIEYRHLFGCNTSFEDIGDGVKGDKTNKELEDFFETVYLDEEIEGETFAYQVLKEKTYLHNDEINSESIMSITDDIASGRYAFELAGIWVNEDHDKVFCIGGAENGDWSQRVKFVRVGSEYKSGSYYLTNDSPLSLVYSPYDFDNKQEIPLHVEDGKLISDSDTYSRVDDYLRWSIVGKWENDNYYYKFNNDGTYSYKNADNLYEYIVISDTEVLLQDSKMRFILHEYIREDNSLSVDNRSQMIYNGYYDHGYEEMKSFKESLCGVWKCDDNFNKKILIIYDNGFYDLYSYSDAAGMISYTSLDESSTYTLTNNYTLHFNTMIIQDYFYDYYSDTLSSSGNIFYRL